MGGVEFWINHPDFQLIKPEDPGNPAWCPQSVRFAEWGDTLIARVAQDPAPGKVAFAKWRLLDRYMRRYHEAPPDHSETNLDNHPCLHQALVAIHEGLEDAELSAGLPELAWPEPERIVPTPEHPVIDGDVAPAPGPPVTEESGIELGDAEDEPGVTAKPEPSRTRPESSLEVRPSVTGRLSLTGPEGS